MFANPETEPIVQRLAAYREALLGHPLVTAARAGAIPPDVLHELAFHQYSDSILWIPMLAQMKSKASRSRRLRQAIEDNIAHEAGLGGVSHVELARRMMRSLGRRDLRGLPTTTFATTASMWLSDGFAREGEPEVAGFLYVAESLVPLLFAELAPCFGALACDTTYFTEHVRVDADEHAGWMADAIAEVLALYGPDARDAILEGMRDAWEETLEAPDQLAARLPGGASCSSP